MGTTERMRAYSMDLRERVVAAVDRGMTQEQAAVTFGVSVNTVARYLTRRRNTGSLAPTAYRHGPRPEKMQRLQAWLAARRQRGGGATPRARAPPPAPHRPSPENGPRVRAWLRARLQQAADATLAEHAAAFTAEHG